MYSYTYTYMYRHGCILLIPQLSIPHPTEFISRGPRALYNIYGKKNRYINLISLEYLLSNYTS